MVGDCRQHGSEDFTVTMRPRLGSAGGDGTCERVKGIRGGFEGRCAKAPGSAAGRGRR